MTTHALLLIDHAEAKLFHVDAGDGGGALLRAHTHHTRHDKHKADGKHTTDRVFLDAVTSELRGIGEILVVGPGNAKSELVSHLEEHAKDVRAHVVAVETVDHPTDNQLKALAKERFKAIDLWR